MVSIGRRVALSSYVAVLWLGAIVVVLVQRVPRAPLPTEAIEDVARQLEGQKTPWPKPSLKIRPVPGLLFDRELTSFVESLQVHLQQSCDISAQEAELPERLKRCKELDTLKCVEHLENDVVKQPATNDQLRRHFTVFIAPASPNRDGPPQSSLILDASTAGILFWNKEDASLRTMDSLAEALVQQLRITWFQQLQLGSEVPLLELAPSYVFSFFLVGECDRRVAWDFSKSVLGPYLLHFLHRLHFLFDFEVDSQAVQCSPLSGRHASSGATVVDATALQADFLRQAGEWPGDVVTKPARWLPPLVRFVAFWPSAPVTVQNAEKKPQASFAVQGWGIAAIANHSKATGKGVEVLPASEAQRVASAWVSNLRSWLTLSPDASVPMTSNGKAAKLELLVCRPRLQGIADWELLLVAEAVHGFFLRRAAETLQDFLALVQSLPDLVIRAEIGQIAQEAALAANHGLVTAEKGNLAEVLAASRKAYTLALETSHDDTVVAEMFFSWEFKYAVYLPAGLPIALPVVVSVIREFSRMRALRRARMTGA